MDGRLARRARPTPTPWFQDQAGRAHPPDQDAQAGSLKKSPAATGTAQAIFAAYAEAWPRNSRDQTVAAELAAQIPRDLRPHHVTELHIASLVAGWKRRWSVSTVYNHTFTLRRVLRHFRDLTGVSLLHAVPRARPPVARTITATPEELDRAWQHARPIERVWLTLTLQTALRIGDVIALAPRDYDEQARVLTFTQRKTRTPVRLPVTEELHQILEHAPGQPDDTSTPYLERYNGKPVSKTTVQAWWKRLKKRAAIRTEVTPHDLRRTLGKTTYDALRDIRAVQALLGHRHVQSTFRYLGGHDEAQLRGVLTEFFRRMPTEVKQ